MKLQEFWGIFWHKQLTCPFLFKRHYSRHISACYTTLFLILIRDPLLIILVTKNVIIKWKWKSLKQVIWSNNFCKSSILPVKTLELPNDIIHIRYNIYNIYLQRLFFDIMSSTVLLLNIDLQRFIFYKWKAIIQISNQITRKENCYY